MTRGRSQLGFTVVELVAVIVLVGILSAYAVMRRVSSADVTISSQGQLLAASLRHAQTLASSWGKTLVFTSTSTKYSVSCKVAGQAPCDNSPVIDPASNQNFENPVEKSVTLTVSPVGTTLYFDSMGRPVDAAGALLTSDVVYTLTAPSNVTQTVTVGATTGRVY